MHVHAKQPTQHRYTWVGRLSIVLICAECAPIKLPIDLQTGDF